MKRLLSTLVAALLTAAAASAQTATLTSSAGTYGAAQGQLTLTATINFPANANTIASVAVTNGGSGYTSAPTVTFDSFEIGSGASATATVSGGVVTAVTVTNGGSGYIENPTVIFSGPGTGATANAVAVLPTAIGFKVGLPAGWAFLSQNFTSGTPATQPAVGANVLEWSFSSFPAGKLQWTFVVRYPAGMTGDKVISVDSTQSIYKPGDVPLTVADLTITPAPTAPQFSTHPADASVTVGSNATFTAAASGYPAATYQWKLGTTNLTNGTNAAGTVISGATSATLTLTGVHKADAGSYTVVASNSAGSVTSNAATLTVASASQTITFGALPAKTFGDADFALSATASSGLNVTYTSSNPAVATVSGNSVHIVGAGTTTITAQQAGNADFAAATDVPQTLTVAKATATVSLASLSQVYTGSPRSVSATTTPAGLTVGVTYDGSATAPTAVGSYPVVATISDPNFTGTASGTLQITKADQTITFAALPSLAFGDAPFQLAATSSSGLPVTYTTSDASVIAVSGTTATVAGVGPVTITASQAGDANYNAATSVQRNTTVGNARQTITFAALPAKTFGDADFTLTATASSALTVTFTSSNPSVATVSGNSVHIVGAGTTTITASQAGSTNFSAAEDVQRTLTVGKATATVTLGGLSATYNGSPANATATTNPAGLTVNFTYNGSATAPTNAGTYAVVGTISDANYQGSATGSLVIAKAAQTITFGSLASKVVGDADFSISATSTSGEAVTFVSSTPAVATVTGTTVHIVGAGTATLTARQSGNANYNAATDVAQTLTVGKGTATVTLSVSSKPYTGSPLQPTATTTPAGLVVTYAFDGRSTPPVAVGSYPVTATVSDANYTGTASGTFTITKADQTIVFGGLDPVVLSSGTRTIVATASSGLPVSFASSDTAVATIDGSTATLVAVGNTTITASQAGNENYNAAATVARVLRVIDGIAPVFTQGPADVTVAPGATATFTVTAVGTPAPSYEWYTRTGPDAPWVLMLNPSKYEGTNTSTLKVLSVTADMSGHQFMCMIANVAEQNIPSNFATLTVAAAPVFTTEPADRAIDGPATVTFNAVATGAPEPTLKWQTRASAEGTWSDIVDGAPYAGATTGTLSVAATTALSGSQYRAIASNSVQAGVTSRIALLTVGEPVVAPQITTQPTDVSVLAGSSAVFTVVASGTGPLTYQWAKGTAAIAGATGASLTLDTVAEANSGEYSVVVTGAAGAATSRAAKLTVTPVTAGAPAVVQQPVSQTVARGKLVVFNCDIDDTPAPVPTAGTPRTLALTTTAYQWHFNGVPLVDGTFGTTVISGATTKTLSIDNPTDANAGVYTCTVTTSVGTVMSKPAMLAVQASAVNSGRLLNLSARGQVGTGGDVMIVGYVVSGNAPLPVLVRAAGPAIAKAPFNVPGTLSNPSIELHQVVDQVDSVIGTNTGWAGNGTIKTLADSLYAFDWGTEATPDSALLRNNAAGVYTAVISGAAGSTAPTGVALAEMYDASLNAAYDPATSPHLVNISVRGKVGTGANQLIVGFVVGGTTSTTVLIRAAGPAIAKAPFSVPGTLADPKIEIHQRVNDVDTILATNTGWGANAEIGRAAAKVYAFPWGDQATADSAILMTLPPGAYTAVVSGAAGGTGVSLVEVYEVP